MKRNTTIEKTNKPFGWHTIVDGAGFDKKAINDPENIQAFVDDLLDKIEMVKIGDTQILWCDTHDPKKIGYTVIQILQDSNLTAHFCSYDNTGYIDIFSCKEYEPKDVIQLIELYFNPVEVYYRTIARNAPRI